MAVEGLGFLRDEPKTSKAEAIRAEKLLAPAKSERSSAWVHHYL